MRRDDCVDALLNECAEGEYVFPDYGGYCFAGVPGACLDVLDGRPDGVPTLPDDAFDDVDLAGVERVLFVLIDGLGYDQWCRAEDDDHLETELLAWIGEAGTVRPLTSVFPSETAAAVPTAHTGQYPVEHGLLGWWQYVEGVGRVQALPYLTPDDEPVAEAHPHAPPPMETLYEADPLYVRLPDRVGSTVLEPAAYGGAVEGKFSEGPDRTLGYDTLPEFGVELRQSLETGSGPEYLFAYLPQVDDASHQVGPDDDVTGATLEAVLATLRRELDRLEPGVADETLLVVSADHGHVDTGGDNVDLRGFDPVWDALEEGPDGEPIPPQGSSRQVHLHLQDGTVGAVRDALEAEFGCRTFTREEYEARELFGPASPSATYERHAPDLLCVPRERGLWYDDVGLAEVGKHGGLTRAEMLVPFAAARAADLR